MKFDSSRLRILPCHSWRSANRCLRLILPSRCPIRPSARAQTLYGNAGIPLVQWPDGRDVDEFETGKNLYFRDGDGNLLELISHSYVKEGVLLPSGPCKVIYLREVGFPTDDVAQLREWFKRVLQLKTRNESDTFNFVIGGTAHAIVASTSRRWIPIAMRALPPTITVSFGVTDTGFIEQVRGHVKDEDVLFESREELHWRQYGYGLRLYRHCRF